jgi:hypothetical protein
VTPAVINETVEAPGFVVTVFELTSATVDTPVDLSQTVDTPDGSFSMKLDYWFETTSGELSILLDDVLLGSIFAIDPVLGSFQTASFPVNDAQLLSKTGIVLTITLSGVEGSTVLVDDVVFPGLSNGDFESGGLDPWLASASGTGSATVIPEPAVSTLALAALGTLRLLARRRRR